MADVMEAPMEDRRGDSPLPPPPPPPLRRREVDSKERREERDDRLPLPPPLPTGRGDREREYRRRSSASPPPYRDRRHSPPRRSPSPVPFKRSRRDDGGYDRRRGGSRGGYGMEDRRYDYGGGHERGGRGGGGYGDERGRYGGRQSDWLDSGRGFGDGSNSGMTQREGLMSYKQFIQELEDDVLPAEAQHRYEEYKSEYITTQKRAYFEAHKEEDWLKDKYHPNNLLTVIERRNEQARAVAKEFLLDLQSGNLDLGPGLTASALNKSGHGSDFANSEDEADAGGNRRRHGRGPVKENDLLSSAPKAHPVSSESRRVQVDIEQAQALAHKLDNEKGIEDNVLTSSDRDKFEGDRSHGGSMGPIIIIRGLTTVKGLEGVELLDTLITYLWRIHGLDYYGTSETNEPKGLRHVRAESKTYDGSDKTGTEWEQKLDLFWRERLHGQDPLETMAAKEKIDAASAEILDPFVRKIRDEKYGWKYGCGAKGCTKLFHAAEFVHKHLKLKHPDLVMELTSKLREDLYFQNYMNDANAPGGTPVMQQPTLKDKAPRRRHILENRLRDERGNRREHDDDRYNRNENSDMQNNGRSEGGIQDDPMYDAYGEQGLGGAPPFPPDIPPPPPVLMPVPGAGPLGPFVPAPPEVAMRMLREQGGPPPFEVNGGSRGRKGRLGPQVSGPAPLVAMPAAFRHDPRHIRSYQDLDAPEDEVTVIDYRSL